MVRSVPMAMSEMCTRSSLVLASQFLDIKVSMGIG